MTNPERLVAIGQSLEGRYGTDAVGAAICQAVEKRINLPTDHDIRQWLKTVCWRKLCDEQRATTTRAQLCRVNSTMLWPTRIPAPDQVAELSRHAEAALTAIERGEV